jgi:hypothetical protein
MFACCFCPRQILPLMPKHAGRNAARWPRDSAHSRKSARHRQKSVGVYQRDALTQL